jgi:hypothetical protein
MKYKFAIILLSIIAISGISITASAMPVISSNTINSTTMHKISLQQTYVRMDGSIKAWGTTSAIGAIQAQSQTITLNATSSKQVFSSTAVWSINGSVPTIATRISENFTYSFYTARLVNGSFASLDYNGYSLFMNGTWNLWNMTNTHTVVTSPNGSVFSINNNQNITPLATQAYGELSVSSDQANFTLAINGEQALTGSVFKQATITTNKMVNPFAIDGATTVTSSELSSVVKAYGSMPGMANYDQRLDFCSHYRIDICDLSTAAANLNASQ